MPAVEINPRVKSILAELRRGYEQIYGDRMVKLVLFGSQARGEAREDSDIDVLVVLKGPVEPAKERDRIGEFRAALCLEHGVVVACIYMSEEQYRQERSPLLVSVRREGMAL